MIAAYAAASAGQAAGQAAGAAWLVLAACWVLLLLQHSEPLAVAAAAAEPAVGALGRLALAQVGVRLLTAAPVLLLLRTVELLRVARG